MSHAGATASHAAAISQNFGDLADGRLSASASQPTLTPAATKPLGRSRQPRLAATRQSADDEDEEEEEKEDEKRDPSATEREQQVFEEVEGQVGPIVDESEAPVLYETFRAVFEHLSLAQKRLFPAHILSVNKLYIVDSPDKNAFVVRLKSQGIRKSSNIVFVTTGLLKAMHEKGRGRQPMRDLVVRMAGIIAHELAHPLDFVDDEGITQNWGELAGMQAMEIRADLEAIAILKEAGYPVDGIYQALKVLFKKADEEGTIFSEFGQTHPADEVRLAMQRMALTLRRYRQGKAQEKHPSGLIPPSLLRELYALKKSDARWSFRKPRNLMDAFERVRRLIDPKTKQEKAEYEKTKKEYKIVEFNRLVLTIDTMLKEKGDSLDEKEWDRLFWFAKQLGGEYGGWVYTRSGMRENFTQENNSIEFLRYLEHAEYIRTIPVFNSKRYLDWVGKRFVSGKGIERRTASLRNLVALETMFSRFSRELAAGMRSLIRRAKGKARARFEELVSPDGDDLFVELRLHMAKLFHEKVLPKLSPAERLWFQIGKTEQDFSYVYPQFKPDGEAAGILNDRMELLGHPRRRALAQWYRELLKTVWKERGYHGVLDLIRDDSAMNWDALFAALAIDPQAGYSQVVQAVKQFSSTPAYARLTKAVARLRKPGYAINQEEDLYWTDDTLAPFLSGEPNQGMRKSPATVVSAKALFNANYLKQRPQLFRRIYRRKLAGKLAAAKPGLGVESFLRAHEAVIKDMIGVPRQKLIPLLIDVQASVVSESKLSEESKKRILETLFIKSHQRGTKRPGVALQITYKEYTGVDSPFYRGFWLNEETHGANKTVMKTLLKHGLLKDHWEFFELLVKDERWTEQMDDQGKYRKHFQALAKFRPELVADLEKRLAKQSGERQRFAELRKLAGSVLDPNEGEYSDSSVVNSREIREIKNAFAAALAKLPAKDEELYPVFYRLTGSGPTRSTDAFFRGYFERHYGGTLDRQSYKNMMLLLENHRLASTNLQLLMAKKALEPEIRRLENRAPHINELNDIVEKLKTFVPDDSSRKDEFLESVAWRLKLRDVAVGALIEDEKSYNWRKTSPVLVRLGSAASKELSRLDRRSREELIEYLIDPEGREMPKTVVKKIKQGIYQDAIKTAPKILNKKNREKAAKKLKEAGVTAADIQLRIEAALMDSTPYERIPLFELLIAGGRNSLMNEWDFPLNITRTFLKYEPDSIEERLLLAFLKVVPEHERSVSLAYLLSQVGEDKASVNDIFEVFQAVGVKFAQLNSVWKFLGEDIARENRKLKDRAKPLSLADILEVMNEQMTEAELAQIKTIKRILGSASLNTVVLVELEDGRELAMAVQRPHAGEQIEGNFELGGKFLDEARGQGLLPGSRLMDTLLGSFKQQLDDELRMDLSAEKMQSAAGLYENFNASMRSQLRGWSFRVPALAEGFAVHPRILFMQKADGVPFDSKELSDAVRAEVGPALADSSLRKLFRFGWFDPDRHQGNFLIDPKTKTIWALDFGQAETFSKTSRWRSDDRAVLAQFLLAVSRSDAPSVARWGYGMSAQGAPSNAAPLERALASALSSGGNIAERLLAVVNTFADNGVAFDKKFAFGAFKGLMVLYGEHYVDDARFQSLMESEIRLLLAREKLPYALLTKLGGLFSGRRTANPAATREPQEMDLIPLAGPQGVERLEAWVPLKEKALGGQDAASEMVREGVFVPGPVSQFFADVLSRESFAGTESALDIGTGDGFLSVKLAGRVRSVLAADIDPKAAQAAEKNFRRHSIANAQAAVSDVYAGLPSGRFDVILANPPYLPQPDSAAPAGADSAWNGGPDGREIIAKIVSGAKERLAKNGRLYLSESSASDIRKTARELEGAGFQTEILAQRFMPFSSVSWSRAEFLVRRGIGIYEHPTLGPGMIVYVLKASLR